MQLFYNKFSATIEKTYPKQNVFAKNTLNDTLHYFGY